MSGEFALIDWIRRQTAQHPRLAVGIGDDTAILQYPAPSDALLTVDMLMEGVHFTLPADDLRRVGRKALAVNLSDIAAMAGRPVAALVSVALPRSGGRQQAEALYAGLQPLAEEFGVALAGGDTNSWNGPLVISVTLIGETAGRGAVLRSGARPGDWIMTTGSFGGSLGGKHFEFTPRIHEALALNSAAPIHAMLDVSDGLAADLYHILDESKVGARLWADHIPISDHVIATDTGKSRLAHALSDGEDFELVFTVAPADGQRLLDSPPISVPLTHIGEITAGSGGEIVYADGVVELLSRAGWEHACD